MRGSDGRPGDGATGGTIGSQARMAVEKRKERRAAKETNAGAGQFGNEETVTVKWKESICLADMTSVGLPCAAQPCLLCFPTSALHPPHFRSCLNLSFLTICI